MLNLRSWLMFEVSGRRMLLRRRKPRRGPIRPPYYRDWIRQQGCRVCGSAGTLGYWHTRDLRAVQDFLSHADPRHPTKLPWIKEALEAFGKRLVVSVEEAAGTHPAHLRPGRSQHGFQIVGDARPRRMRLRAARREVPVRLREDSQKER